MAQIDFRSYLANSENFPKHRQSLNVNDLLANATTSQNAQSTNDFCQTNYSTGVEFQSYLPKTRRCDGATEINSAQNYFKIPSAGKESTLKHRILSNSRTQKNNNNIISSNHHDDNK